MYEFWVYFDGQTYTIRDKSRKRICSSSAISEAYDGLNQESCIAELPEKYYSLYRHHYVCFSLPGLPKDGAQFAEIAEQMKQLESDFSDRINGRK